MNSHVRKIFIPAGVRTFLPPEKINTEDFITYGISYYTTKCIYKGKILELKVNDK